MQAGTVIVPKMKPAREVILIVVVSECAMAQAMSVYQYPLKGKGTYSYTHPDYGSIIVRFDKEPEYAWDSMAVDTPDNHNARLLYHAAVTVSMNFGPDASGSFTSRIPNALINYFGYYKSAKRVARYANMDEWIQLLGNELLAGRPLVYSGDNDDGEPGHAFNIDGVTNDGYFHVNWGWSGKYNGYFTLNNLNPGSNEFSAHHEAVINIRPPVYAPTDLDLTKTTVKKECRLVPMWAGSKLQMKPRIMSMSFT